MSSHKAINNIEDLCKLVSEGETDWKKYGHVRAFEHEGMIGFDYTPEAEFEGTWNAFERMSRGLVLDRNTGAVLARPYDKFFNLGQHNAFPTSKIQYALEKADGSLGIFFFDQNGIFRCNTRGSFTSDQAVFGKALAIDYNVNCELPKEHTLLAEIIYPDNRIVVDYGGWKGLIVHGVRNNITGEYWNRQALQLLELQVGHPQFRMATQYPIESHEAAVELVSSFKGVECEGIVIVTETEERFKIKGEDYLRLHRLVTNVTPKRVWELLLAGDYNEYRKQIPDEFLEEFDAYAEDIQNKVRDWTDTAKAYYEDAPKEVLEGTQKDFALWVNGIQEPLYRPYLFRYHSTKNWTFIERMFLDNWKKITGYEGA